MGTLVRSCSHAGVAFRAAILLALFCLPANLRGSDSAVWQAARELVQAALTSARAACSNQPASAEAAWQLGRAYFEAGELAETKQERAKLAELGMAACRRGVELQSNCAGAHYYWGLNLGQLARTKGIGALRLVAPMRDHFQNALRLDERFDNGGSHRNLGYLFRDAPSWGSIGDRAKAKFHLQRAVELSPDYPENRLALLEGRVQWGERELALKELAALEELWPKAKARFTGPVWQVTWEDWDRLLAHLAKKVRKSG